MARTGGFRAAAPVIATKIAIPRRRSDTLRRARLVDGIHQMIDRQLYLVVAPAGYGKTTLLVDFASDSAMPVCWYSLSASDAEPAVFLEYLVAAIQSRFPRFGQDTRRVMAQADFRTDAISVLAALINEVQQRIPEYFAVILDDYHEVNHNQAINELVDTLLKHAPENLKLILSSRTMPRLELSRLAALRQAAGVGQKDLRFTANEVRDLMREAYQTVLPDRVVEELTARSEGWITGIILTTHTMWQGLFESMIRNSGQEQLYGYLANEVFERQTAAVQRFLLASSILEDLEPAIAGPLAGSARADSILRHLQEGNLFVSELEGRKRVYRYHHLFRDFLRSRLDEGAHGLSRLDLERKAGLLYQQRDRHEEAISHLLAAQAYEQAAKSILAVAEEAFDRGRLDTLAGWLDRLPAALLAQQPRLRLWRAQVAIQKGELEEAVRLCEQVEASAEDTRFAAEAKVHRAAAKRLLGHTEETLRLCQEALAEFGAETTKRRALAYRTLGTALWRAGSLDDSRHALQQAHTIFDRLGDIGAAAYVQNDLGVVAMYDGHLGEARLHLSSAAALMEKIGNAGRWGLTLSNLGVITYLEDDSRDAISLLDQARDKGETGLFPYTVVVSATSLGDVYRDLGQYADAERHYASARAVAEQLVDRAELLELYCQMADCYRLQRLYSKAQVLLRQVESQGSGYIRAQGRMLRGICALEQGRFRQARQLLQSALNDLEPIGYRYLAARTIFHQAMLEYQTGKAGAGDRLLEQSLAMLEELGYSHFLTVDLRRWRSEVEEAAARGVGEGFLTDKLHRLTSAEAPARSGRKPRLVQRGQSVRVRLLGQIEVLLNGRAVPSQAWASHTARELFVYLMLHPEGAPKDRLMAILAPESSLARANSQFHVAAYRLRRALYHGCLLFDGDYYRLDPALHVDCDVLAFREALVRADHATRGSDQELEELRRAVDLYQGRLLEGFYSDWVLAEQRRVEDQFLHAASRLATLYLEAGELRAAIEAAERGLTADFSLEELHEVIIRAQLRQGLRADAARQIERYRAYLQEELGAELPPRLRDLIRGEQPERPRLLASR